MGHSISRVKYDTDGLWDQSAFRTVLLAVAVVTLVRVAYLGFNLVPLFGDEAQYWSWSLEPAFGYYSKPPMVAWLIAATTAVAGQGEFAVKLASPLTHAVTALMIFFIGCRLGGRRAGMWSSILYLTMPAVSYSCGIISTDPPLLMFWSVALYGFVRAIDPQPGADRAVYWWILTGIGLGFALLSKYTAVAFPISMMLYLAITPRRRAVLRSPGPYLALALALIVFLPNLLWNAEHGFVSILHVKDNAHWSGGLLHPGRLAEFVFAQFGIFGPLPFVCLLVMIFRWRRLARHESLNLLLWFTAPLLAAICSQAFVSRAYANWAAPIYVAASVAVTTWLLSLNKERWITATVLVHLAAGIVLASYEPVVRSFDLNVPARFDLLKRVRGWPEVGKELARLRREHSDPLLLVDNRMLMAECLYYGAVPLDSAFSWNPSGVVENHYDLVTDMNGALGRNFLFISAAPMADSLGACFADAQALTPIVVQTHPDRRLRLNVYRLDRFRGYGR